MPVAVPLLRAACVFALFRVNLSAALFGGVECLAEVILIIRGRNPPRTLAGREDGLQRDFPPLGRNDVCGGVERREHPLQLPHLVLRAPVLLVHDDVVSALDLLDQKVDHLPLRVDVLLGVLGAEIGALGDLLAGGVQREEVGCVHHRDHGLKLGLLHRDVPRLACLDKLPPDVLRLRHPRHFDEDVVVGETAAFRQAEKLHDTREKLV
mmetsp:Transcript_36863/g.87241  ORF Transcript_36863/g.87241 Transcript_36863/m.87241 type:complete len:209 (-) Transcript_36863:388-1014(-)